MASVHHDPLLQEEVMHNHLAGDVSDLTATLDPRYVNITGDTMTGALINTLATGNSLVWDTNTLIVDATNHRVGIGTTAPLSVLAVNTSGTDDEAQALQMMIPESATGSARIGLHTTAGRQQAYIRFSKLTANTNRSGKIEFLLNPSASEAGVSGLTIVDTGAGTGASYVGISGSLGVGTDTPTVSMELRDGQANGSMRIGADVAARTLTANTRKIGRIVAPTYAGAGDGLNVFVLGTDSNGGTHQLSFGGVAGGTPYAATVLSFFTGADSTTQGGTERIRVTPSGLVGISTDSPSGRFHINGITDDQQLIIGGHSTQTANLTEWRNSSGTVLSYIRSGGQLSLYPSFTTDSTDITFDAYRSYRHTSGNAIGTRFRTEFNPGSAVTTPQMVGGQFVTTKLGAEAMSSISSYLLGGQFIASNGSTANVTTYLAVGGEFYAANSSSTATPTLSNAIAGRFNITANDPITNAYGLQITTPTGGQAVSSYGLYIQDHNVASTNNYAIVTNAGNIVFNEGGDASTDFRVESDTEANMLFVDANADTDGAVYLGGTTNGVKINKGGDLTLLGTAKYERHVQLDAKADGLVANQPTPVDFFTAGGLQYPTTGTKYAFTQWEIPDDWDGTDVYIEIDWFPDSGAMSGTDAIKWDIEYRAIAEGELINNGTSVTVTSTNSDDNAQYKTIHTRFTLTYNNANQPLTAQDHMYFKVSRDTSVTGDFSGSATVTAYEIIYNSKGFPTSN